MKKKISLRFKLNAPILFIFLIIFILSSYVIIHRETSIAKETIITSAVSFANLSASEMVLNYETYYETGFLKFKELMTYQINGNQDIERIQIYNVSGILLFDSDELQDGKYDDSKYGPRTISESDLLSSIEKLEQTIIKSENENFEIIQPYIHDWGPHYYSIRYIFSFSRLAELQQEMIVSVSLYFALFFILSSIIIVLLFNQYITKPIKTLIKGVRKIQDGVLGEKIEIRSSDELGELSSSFNDMTQKLETSNRQLEKNIQQKNQLLIQLSHDLKNPLGPIINTISLLHEMEKDDSKKELIDILQRNTDYIKNLVIRTIEYMKVNTANSPLCFKKTRLLDSIEKIIAIKKPLINKKNISVTVDINSELMVMVDILYLEELLNNIIDNAIIYNKDGGKIHFSAERTKEFIKISVSDTGIGLEEGQLEQVFNEFYKVDPSRHVFESSGLGLTISKRIVELHGGKIWIESVGKNKGITVKFTLKSY